MAIRWSAVLCRIGQASSDGNLRGFRKSFSKLITLSILSLTNNLKNTQLLLSGIILTHIHLTSSPNRTINAHPLHEKHRRGRNVVFTQIQPRLCHYFQNKAAREDRVQYSHLPIAQFSQNLAREDYIIGTYEDNCAISFEMFRNKMEFCFLHLDWMWTA